MPCVPPASIEPNVPVPSMVIDLPIVIPPKPPGSSTLVSPARFVLRMAPAKVLHGWVRLQEFMSSPTPDTQVRLACAAAIKGNDIMATRTNRVLELAGDSSISQPP